MGTCYKYSIACSLVFFKVALVLVNIRFICHVHEARDLRKTRICTINTALKKNQSSINQHHICITIQWYLYTLIKACIPTVYLFYNNILISELTSLKEVKVVKI